MLIDKLSEKLKFTIAYRGRYGFWRLVNLFIFGLLVFGAMSTYYFIYQNIYSTIANTNAIVYLKPNRDVFEFDLEAYEKAKDVIRQKKVLEEIPPNVRNIFLYNVKNSTST